MIYYIPAFELIPAIGDLEGNKPSYNKTMLQIEVIDSNIISVEECYGIDESRIVK